MILRDLEWAFAALDDEQRTYAVRAVRGLDAITSRTPEHSRARIAWLVAGMTAEDLDRLVAIAETIAPYAAELET